MKMAVKHMAHFPKGVYGCLLAFLAIYMHYAPFEGGCALGVVECNYNCNCKIESIFNHFGGAFVVVDGCHSPKHNCKVFFASCSFVAIFAIEGHDKWLSFFSHALTGHKCTSIIRKDEILHAKANFKDRSSITMYIA